MGNNVSVQLLCDVDSCWHTQEWVIVVDGVVRARLCRSCWDYLCRGGSRRLKNGALVRMALVQRDHQISCGVQGCNSQAVQEISISLWPGPSPTSNVHVCLCLEHDQTPTELVLKGGITLYIFR